MVTCQSANQLKTPAKVSWAFKMVSQFGSLGYTIMGKTADLTVVQKTIIDTLHKEGKPQTFIAKEAGCSQSAVSKHVNRKFEWKEKVWKENMHNQLRELQPYEDCQAKSIQEFGWTSQEWTEAGIVASRATTHRRIKEFGYSCRQRRLFWNQHHCTHLPEILEHFMLPSADQLFKDADFIFQQDLAPAHTAKSTKSWLNDHGVGVLDWPANSPHLDPKSIWSNSQTDHLHATPNWGSIKAWGAPTKHWIHIK